jgi:hypothetical protein
VLSNVVTTGSEDEGGGRGSCSVAKVRRDMLTGSLSQGEVLGGRDFEENVSTLGSSGWDDTGVSFA